MGPKGGVTMSVRLMAAGVAMALCVAGPLQPLAEAQQAQPPMEARSAPSAKRGPDGYDVGAAIMTVAGAPLKGIVCGIGAVVGATLFVATFGSADRASAAVVREGCDVRWLVLGEHIRPDPGPERMLEVDPDPQAGLR
jgi:hypothetical protein